jgi:hypothetical protein
MSSTTAPTSVSGTPSRRLQRRLIVLAAALLVGTSAAVVNATPAFAHDYGGVDMNAACRSQYGPDWYSGLAAANVYAWGCHNWWGGALQPIDVARQCHEQYGWNDVTGTQFTPRSTITTIRGAGSVRLAADGIARAYGFG